MFFLQSGTYRYRSVSGALSTIYRTEGVKGLFTGLGATLARDVPFSAIYFATYTQLKQTTKDVGVALYKMHETYMNTVFIDRKPLQTTLFAE